MTFKENLIIELLKAIPFLIVGLITAYIAFRQYKIEKSRLHKDLYQIRLKVFKIIDRIQFQLVSKREIDPEMLNRVSFDIEERYFVFSDDLNNKIDDFVHLVWGAMELKLNKKDKESDDKIEQIILSSNDIKDKIRRETKIK